MKGINIDGERERKCEREKIPSKESGREGKNGKRTKTLGIAYCRARHPLSFPSASPSLPLTLTRSPIWLRLFLTWGL